MNDESDERGGCVLVLRDITAEQEALDLLKMREHKAHELVLRSVGTITIADQDGNVSESTGEVRPTLGYPSGWWKGKNAFDLLHPDDIDRAATAWSELITFPGHVIHEVFRARHMDGHYEQVEFTGVNLLDDPYVQGVVISHRDGSREKEAERLLHDEAEILELIACDANPAQVFPEIVTMIEYHTGGVAGLFLETSTTKTIVVGASGSMPEELVEIVRSTPLLSADSTAAKWLDATPLSPDFENHTDARRLPKLPPYTGFEQPGRQQSSTIAPGSPVDFSAYGSANLASHRTTSMTSPQQRHTWHPSHSSVTAGNASWSPTRDTTNQRVCPIGCRSSKSSTLLSRPHEVNKHRWRSC